MLFVCSLKFFAKDDAFHPLIYPESASISRPLIGCLAARAHSAASFRIHKNPWIPNLLANYPSGVDRNWHKAALHFFLCRNKEINLWKNALVNYGDLPLNSEYGLSKFSKITHLSLVLIPNSLNWIKLVVPPFLKNAFWRFSSLSFIFLTTSLALSLLCLNLCLNLEGNRLPAGELNSCSGLLQFRSGSTPRPEYCGPRGD